MRAGLVMLFAVLCAAALPARAQLGPARTGSFAEADNVATAMTNPAGLTRISGEQFVLDSMIAYSTGDFEVKPGSTETGGNPKNDDSIWGIPSLAWARPLGERYRIGFSVAVPAGIGTDYGSSWAGRYMAQESSLFFVNMAPVVAWRVNEWLSLGGGVNVVYASFDNEVGVRNLAPGEGDGKMELELSGWSVGGGVSVLLEPSPRTRFGIAYRSASDADLEGTPRWTNLGPLLDAALGPVKGQRVDLELTIPQVLSGGLYHEFTPRLSVTADLSWVDFSEFGKVDISVSTVSTTLDADYDDLWIGSFGMRYALSEAWAVAAGVTYLSSGVDSDDRTLALPWDEIWMFGVGLERQLNPNLRLFASLGISIPGDGDIDQQSTPLSGRLVGEFEDRRTYLLQLSLVWDR